MDKGRPFRMSQPGDKRPVNVNKPEPKPQVPEESSRAREPLAAKEIKAEEPARIEPQATDPVQTTKEKKEEPQPVDKKILSKPESKPQVSTEPPVVKEVPPRQRPAVKEAPSSTRRTGVLRRRSKEGRRLPKRFVLPIAGVIIASILGLLAWTSMRNAGMAIDSSKYQAVFFENGNVYFGKLQSANGEYYKVTSVYYPQTQTSGATSPEDQQPAAANQNNITLLKLSDAVHGPEDEMMIAKDQVLFYQNLRSDSRVAQLIEDQENAN